MIISRFAMQRNDCLMAALEAARDAFSMLSTDEERRSGVEEIIRNLENTESFDSLWFNEHVVVPALSSVREHLSRIGQEHLRAAVALQAIRVLENLNLPVRLLIQFEHELRWCKTMAQRVAEGRETLERRCDRLRERIRQEAEALAATYDIPQKVKDLFVEEAVIAENDKDEGAMNWLVTKFFDLLPTANDDI